MQADRAPGAPAPADDPQAPPAPETAPLTEPRPRRLRLFEDWERTVAVSIGIVALTAALFTYLAVRQDDASSEARGQATLETLQLQRQQLNAAIRVQAESGAADRYRRTLAEAEALEAQAAKEGPRAAELRARALELRYVADGYKEANFDAGRLSGTTSTATYDTSRRLETIQGYEAFEAIPADQPQHTAQVADDRHDQSVRTLLLVVLLLLLVVLLTLGRVLPRRTRPVVLAIAALGWAGAVAGAVLNGMSG